MFGFFKKNKKDIFPKDLLEMTIDEFEEKLLNLNEMIEDGFEVTQEQDDLIKKLIKLIKENKKEGL